MFGNHFQQTISDSTMSLVVKELNARDVDSYRERAKVADYSMLREFYELDMDRCLGYSKTEIEELVSETSDAFKKELLRDLRPRGDGRAILRQVSPMTWTTQAYETVFAAIVKREENRYDIVFMRARQIREVNKNKLLGAGLHFCVNALAGYAAGGFWGAGVAAGYTGKEKVEKLAGDLEKEMPNVLAGYIANEMVTRKILEVRNDELYLTIGS